MSNIHAVDVLIQIRDFLFESREIWTLEMFCNYTGYSRDYVYQLTSKRKITYFTRDGGKKIFFKREDVIDFITSNPIKSKEQLDKEAQ